MYTSIGKTIGKIKQKKNKDGNYYFEWDAPNQTFLDTINIEGVIKMFLFSSNQFRAGMTDDAKNGNLMYLSNANSNLVLLSPWRKQKDGTIFASITNQDRNYGILLDKQKDHYLVYWAFSISPLEIILIRNNPIAFT